MPPTSEIIEAIRSRAPQLCEHTIAPPALHLIHGIDEIEARLREACLDGSAGAAGLAMLGNLLVREGRYLDALDAYAHAANLDPSFADAHLAASELAHILRDEERSAAHRADALERRRCYPDPAPLGERLPMLLVLRDAAYSTNAPLELLVDRSRIAVHKYYVEGDADLPECALVFCAFGYAHAATRAIARANELRRSRATQWINDPLLLKRAARENLAQTLRGITGVQVCETHVVARSDLAMIELPRLVRPIDTHAGSGLALIETPHALQAHVERFPSEAYYASTFHDYRSSDGWYRKYRIIIVDGVAYPYHLAISPRWMVHYQSSPMRRHDWMREEEAAFLLSPRAVFPQWDASTSAIARAAGLDYFGIDVARLADGSMLVFEADPAMLVHDEDEADLFAYKRPYVGRIREALHALIARRARR